MMRTNISESARHDINLVIAVRSGDEKAFGQLMDRYADSIFLMILKMVNYRGVARDLTLESFEKAYLKIHQFEPRFAFSTWLFRIAQNNTIDYLRHKKVAKGLILLSDGDPASDVFQCQDKIQSSMDNPEEAMIKEENAAILHKMVSILNPRYQKLLEMRYFREYSCAEIASELNLPVGTIKVQLFRSRKLLYELMKNSAISCS